MSFVIAVAVGAVCGVLSGFGIGGGSLLVLYMINFTAFNQQTIQGINLVYFLPTATFALISHVKNKMVDFKVALPTVLAGVFATAVSSFAATTISAEILKKAFGVFLICIGVREVFSKKKNGR